MDVINLWFKHDINARRDDKLIKIKMELGIEGIGIYWILVEILYESDSYITEEQLKLFCYDERIDIEKALKVLNIAFKFDKQKGYYIPTQLERVKQREEFSKKQSENAKKRWNKVKRQAPIPDWMQEQMDQEEFEEKKKKILEDIKK